MGDIQHETDLDKAREKLEEVAARQHGGGASAPSSAPPLVPGRRPAQAEPEERHIRPVKNKPKKKKFSEKLKEAFFGDIGDGTITEHIFFNIFVPSFKRVLSDMGNTAINMALGLDPKTRTIGNNTHTSNASVYRDRNYNRGGNNPGYSRRDAICDYTWDEETAKDIYNQLNELIEQFGYATLEDAYSIMDMGNKIRSTDRNWGWTSMRNAEVYPVDSSGEAWVVNMPPAKPINYQ